MSGEIQWNGLIYNNIDICTPMCAFDLNISESVEYIALYIKVFIEIMGP